MSQQCPTCQNQVAVTDANCCANCGSEMPSVGSTSNYTASGSAPSSAAFNPFADLAPQATTTQPDFQAAAGAFVAPADAASAFAVLQKASTQNKHPSHEYLQDTRGLWNYSDMPVCCPQCDYKFNMKDHRRKLRWSSWILIALIVVFSPALGMFIPFLRGIGLWVFIAFLIFLVLLLAKKVHFRCYRCGWTKKFIVRSGVR